MLKKYVPGIDDFGKLHTKTIYYGKSWQGDNPSPDNLQEIYGLYSDTLNGFPVSSGGTYTDENGQQWIADEINIQTNTRIQRVGKTVLDDPSKLFTENGDFWNYPDNSATGILSGTFIGSNYFPTGVFWENADNDFIWTKPDLIAPYFSTVSDLNDFMLEKIEEGKPIEFIYLIDEIVTNST